MRSIDVNDGKLNPALVTDGGMTGIPEQPKRRKIAATRRSEYFWGWVFIAPLTIGFFLFTAFPLVLSVIYSFSEYDLFHAPVFIGFSNFAEVFHDTFFLRSLLNALIYCIGVPIGATLALILSSMLINISKGSLALRMIFYLPTICGAVAVAFIWQWMYAPNYGLLWEFSKKIGIKPVHFLSSNYIMVSMMVMGIWSGLGISVLLFYSSLGNVSKSLYEAADLDGANAFHKFVYITVPGVSPVMFYILITGILGSFQSFTNFQVMTNDQINYSNIMPVWWIYKFTGTYGYRYGYASALGMVFGLLLIMISGIQFLVSKLWVKYDA